MHQMTVSPFLVCRHFEHSLICDVNKPCSAKGKLRPFDERWSEGLLIVCAGTEFFLIEANMRKRMHVASARSANYSAVLKRNSLLSANVFFLAGPRLVSTRK